MNSVNNVGGTRTLEVSVVIPTHNRPALVLRALNSVLSQTLAGIEVIVVIDGSDPSTVSALTRITDSRLRMIELAISVGAAEARNRGIDAAKGEWIALLDDDDEWALDKLEKQIGAARAAKSPYILVFSRMIGRLTSAEYVWPRRLPQPGEPMSEYLFCRKGIAFGEGFLQTSSFFASRRMFQEVPFRREQQRFQDTDWILRACAHPKSRFAVLAEPLVIYHLDDQQDSISRKPDWMYLHQWAVENRCLFTPRAFSFFLATQCVPRASKQGESIGTFCRLVKECIRDGSATPMCLLLCCVFWCIPETVRQRTRDFLSREGKDELSPT